MSNVKKTDAKKKMLKAVFILFCPLIWMFAQLRRGWKLFETRKRKILAGVLSLAMVLSMLPAISLTTFAATPNPLTFTAKADNSSVTLNYASGSDVMVKLGEADWTSYTKGDVIQLNKNDTVSFIGIDIQTDQKNHFESVKYFV